MTAHFNFVSGKLRYAWEFISSSGNNHITNQGRIVPKFFLLPSVSGGVGLAFLEYTTVPNTSTFTLRSDGSAGYEVDWGDGNTDSYTNSSSATHTYSTAGEYIIKITPAEGATYRPYYQNQTTGMSIASVTGTGGSQLGNSLRRAFWNAQNLTSISGTINTSTITNLYQAFRNCVSLTEFPLIDTSNVTSFGSAWNACTSLTSFPAIDTSSGTSFSFAWGSCSSLTSFPYIDTSGATSLMSTWSGCSNIATSFPLIDTSNVTNFNSTWSSCQKIPGAFPAIDTSSGTNFTATWNFCKKITSYPSTLDFSNGTNFQSCWQTNQLLTSFPAFDFSSGTNFQFTWNNCSSMTTYPANMFDTTGTLTSSAFNGAWNNCALSAQSIENILVSLDTNGATNISLSIANGTNAAKTTWSTAANNAYTNLINKGWTISYNA